ncbi:MAG: DUF3786 domain-containing protein [bacterium]
MNEKSDYSLPRQTNLETSLEMARQKLAGLDFHRQCQKAGLEPSGSGAEAPFINRLFRIEKKTLEVLPADQGPEPQMQEKIIILHYLATATGAPRSDRLITYKQVPDGASYYQVFLKRTSGILLSVFKGRFAELMEAARKLGAEEEEGHGDKAFRVKALPRVEYLFVLYEEDEEFEADIKVFFDSSVVEYLPAEDITVLCQMTCLKIVKGQ